MDKAERIEDLLAMLDGEWYEQVEGVYDTVPTWGPRTAAVQEQIASACPEGDIVSWDTRAEDSREHVYLRRSWRPSGPSQSFRLVTEAERAQEDVE